MIVNQRHKTIAYISDGFPRVSETFVSNEIGQLIALGYDVRVFSLHNPQETIIHPAARALLNRTHHTTLPFPRGQVLAALAWLALHRPGHLIKTLRLAAALPGPHYKWTARQAAILARKIAATGAGHIHAHFAGEAARFAFLSASHLGLPFTVTIHGPSDFEQERGTIDVIGDHARAIFTVSDFNKDLIAQQYGVDSTTIHVNPNGIDPAIFAPPDSGERIVNRIVTVARLHTNKGLTYGIEAARILRDKGIAFEWIIIGEGPERTTLEQQIAAASLQGHVILKGAQPADIVREELRQASIFALPSLAEGQPVVYLEAMATGLPVVGTDIVGVSKTVLHGKTGFLAPPKEAVSFAAHLQTLLNDATLGEQMGDAGRASVLDHYVMADRVKFLAGFIG